MNITKTIKDYIEHQELLEKKKKYLVALSGGADSVALLHVLLELGYKNLEACHCNFHLRGEESDRDELFCEQLCLELGVNFHRIHFETQEYAESHKMSIEMAARDLRYRYFDQLMKDIHADGICVAHHQDDSVETVLINLVRGTGIKGLTGIQPKNGHIIRPLLCVERKDIETYLSEKKQEFVTDCTNLEDNVVRNKIRLNIIPLLKEINSSVCQNIAQTAHILTEANKALQEIAHKVQLSEDDNFAEATRRDDYGYIYIQKKWIKEQPSKEYALYMAISPYGFLGNVVEEISSSIDSIGKYWYSDTHRLAIDRDCIILEEKALDNFAEKKIPETGNYMLPAKSILINVEDIEIESDDFFGDINEDRAEEERSIRNFIASEQKLKVSTFAREEVAYPSKQPYCITVDADKVKFPLTLRKVQTGDAFHPYGMTGSKLVSDYLTDIKMDLFHKEKQLVLTDATGYIIWLVGQRSSEICKLTDHTTKVLKIEVETKA